MVFTAGLLSGIGSTRGITLGLKISFQNINFFDQYDILLRKMKKVVLSRQPDICRFVRRNCPKAAEESSAGCSLCPMTEMRSDFESDYR